MPGPNDTLDITAARVEIRAGETARMTPRRIGSLAAAIAAIATETSLLALASLIDAAASGDAAAANRAATTADEVSDHAAQLEHEVSRLLGAAASAADAG